MRSNAVMDAGGAEERVYAQFASGNAFGLLGVTPAIGRVLVPSDDDPAADHDVAVLSYSFWMRRFGGDPAVIGRRVRLERNLYEVVGVARKGFTGVEPGIRTAFWVPLTSTATPESLADPGWHWFKVLGRLAPGHSAEEVRGAMQSVLTHFRRQQVAARWKPGMPTERRDRYLSGRILVRAASNGLSDLRTNFERPLWILTAVVGLVLLLACSNLANLMLARAAARGREMALRLSIGAGRARLVQQMLVEAAAISLAAVALGTLFARVSAPAMKVTDVTQQSTLVTNTMLRERLLALLSGFFALVSLALAGVGLYGVLSYSVVRQTREIGIRIALGATWRTIVGGVLGGIAAYIALGLVTGLGAGLWLARFLTRLLYDVRPGDAATLLLPLSLLLLVAFPAALLPARRAAGVDPMVALRDE